MPLTNYPWYGSQFYTYSIFSGLSLRLGSSMTLTLFKDILSDPVSACSMPRVINVFCKWGQVGCHRYLLHGQGKQEGWAGALAKQSE